MDPTLLATRVRVPPLPHYFVERRQLILSLEESIVRHRLLTVTAPAGFGKTTLLVEWAATSPVQVAWLTLSKHLNEVSRLLRHLIAAWAQLDPLVYQTPPGVLLGGANPDIESVLTALINELSTLDKDLVFVLDDFHLIDDDASLQAMAFLLDHLPDRVHFVLASRSEPPLPLSRYRARQQLTELTTSDLTFSALESGSLLLQTSGRTLTQETIGTIHSRLNGWPAGVLLTGLALHRQKHHATADFAPGDDYIFDFLTETVLSGIPDHQREFLLSTSILERFNDSLCASVCDITPEEARRLLSTLERQGFFLHRLDTGGIWFQYHDLFAQALRAELGKHSAAFVQSLHNRAARWFLEQDDAESAFHHAVASHDPELTTLIVGRYLDSKLFGGQIDVIQRWVDLIPPDWKESHPQLGLAETALFLFSGAFDVAEMRLTTLEQTLTGDESRHDLARVLAIRCFMACFMNDLPRAERYAEEAIRDLPEDDLLYRPGIFGALGDTYRANGHWQQAYDAYIKVLDFKHAYGFHVQSVHLYGALADLNLRQGRLREATAYWERALSVIESPGIWGRIPLSVVSWVYTRLAEVRYEQDDLEAAKAYVNSGSERAVLANDPKSRIASCILAARLEILERNLTAAGSSLESARDLLTRSYTPGWANRLEYAQALFWISADHMKRATDWANRALIDANHRNTDEGELVDLAIARVLITREDVSSLRRARGILSEVSSRARELGRLAVCIEALALESIARWRSGNRQQAVTTLVEAIQLAEPEGYIRLFADLGPPLLPLLREAAQVMGSSDYTDKIISAIPEGERDNDPDGLQEPLTRREQEILQLLSRGMTNHEIAAHLYISRETVKKHTMNIYSKLAVRSRTEAVLVAGKLKLLNQQVPD